MWPSLSLSLTGFQNGERFKMPKLLQPTFSRGEIAPELYGRTDLAAFFTAVASARNMFVHQFGGISNRPGSKFLANISNSSKKAELIPFVFGETDTHLLEFGDGTMRPLRNNSNITETAVSISGVTQAVPVVITTSSAHGYANGDEVLLQDIVGMTVLNNKRYKLTVLSSTTFSLQDLYTGDDVDGTGFDAYVSGGNSYRIYEITSPYSEADLPNIQTEQSFDVLFIAAEGHPRRKLERLGLTNWQFVDMESKPSTSPPTSVSLTVNSTGTDEARYAVVGVNTDTGERSAPGLGFSSYSITGITKADPAVVTVSSSVGEEIQTGNEVALSGINGMTELNDKRFIVTRISATKFALQNIDSTGFSSYSSGGTLQPAFVFSDVVDATAPDEIMVWTGSTGALRYEVYKEVNGIFGLVGETQETEFLDTGDPTPNTSEALPIPRHPFLGSGNFPAAVGAHQQRSAYASTPNDPGRIEFSQTGAFDNANRSIPAKDNDAFGFTLDTRGENAIVRHLVSLKDLIVFTNSSIQSINSRDRAFSLQNLQIDGEDKFGSSRLKPLVVKKNVVFEETNGERVHAAKFAFSSDGLETRDLSLLSPHLFRNNRIKNWAKVSWPEPIIYMVMQDGSALSLTYNPEEQAEVIGWCPWDTTGAYESVASVRASASDRQESVYFVVRRIVDGVEKRFIEVLDERNFDTPEDCYFVDAGLTYDQPQTIESVTQANPAVVTITGHGLSDGDKIDIANAVFQPVENKFGTLVEEDPLSGRRFKVASSTANTFELEKIDSPGTIIDGTDFPEYLGLGEVRFAATTLFGFEHLAGSSLVGLLDGNVSRDLTVNSDGTIELPVPTGRAHIGIPFISEVETLPLEQASAGSISGMVKRPSEIVIRFLRSRGILIKESNIGEQWAEWFQREFEKFGEPTRLKTGDVKFNINTTWNRTSAMQMRQRDPLPMTLLQINTDVKVAQ